MKEYYVAVIKSFKGIIQYSSGKNPKIHCEGEK